MGEDIFTVVTERTNTTQPLEVNMYRNGDKYDTIQADANNIIYINICSIIIIIIIRIIIKNFKEIIFVLFSGYR